MSTFVMFIYEMLKLLTRFSLNFIFTWPNAFIYKIFASKMFIISGIIIYFVFEYYGTYLNEFFQKFLF